MPLKLKTVPLIVLFIYLLVMNLFGEKISSDVQMYLAVGVLLINLWIFRLLVIRGEIPKKNILYLLLFVSLSLLIAAYSYWFA
ncbi:MAG: hypothetical protein ACK4K1_07280 [Flavobacterium sp.]